MNQPVFTIQDANAMLQLARSAPLANMDIAEQVAGVLQRAKAHFEAHFAPPPSEAEPPTEGSGS